jgi:spore coat polysaccharide biosynthesis protein SpsF
VEAIYAELYPTDAAFSTRDILALVDRRPELATLNTSFARNEGYAKSLAADAMNSKKV